MRKIVQQFVSYLVVLCTGILIGTTVSTSTADSLKPAYMVVSGTVIDAFWYSKGYEEAKKLREGKFKADFIVAVEGI